MDLSSKCSAVMSVMDQWVENHPLARGGYVPNNFVWDPGPEIRDYHRIIPYIAKVRTLATGMPSSTPEGTGENPIQQVRDEIAAFIDVVLSMDRHHQVLEIGLGWHGGTHRIWTQIFDRVTTVEIDGEAVERFKFLNREALSPERDHFIVGNSFDASVIAKARETVSGADLLFIDGGHGYDEVLKDWHNYHDLVRPGGIIAFHDTAFDIPPYFEIKRFLSELPNYQAGIEIHSIIRSAMVGISYYYKPGAQPSQAGA